MNHLLPKYVTEEEYNELKNGKKPEEKTADKEKKRRKRKNYDKFSKNS